MRINIVSGDTMALYGDNLGFKPNPIAFCESMITGNVTDPIPFSQSFIAERSKALGTSIDKYKKKFAFQLLKMRATDDVHVYFGEDLFCQLNLITLLAYLERLGIKEVTYHVIFEDEMKQTALIENLDTTGFTEIYKAVLINRTTVGTPLEITNKALMLYSDYLDDNGAIATFIKANPEDTVLQLTVKLIIQYAQYGRGDVQSAELIERVRKSVSEQQS